MSSQSRQRLLAKHVPFSFRINCDDGSAGSSQLATWKPELGDGWYFLGPVPSNGSRPRYGLVVKELQPYTLVDVVGWEKVWDNSRSNSRNNCSLWRGIPPTADYAVMGSLFLTSYGPPSAAETRGIKSVHVDCLSFGRAGDKVWTDGATVSVWDIAPSVGTVETGAFIVADNWSASGPVYSLKSSSVAIID